MEGEVRRIHIIYFLSRMGRVEHPHLIRLHHLHRNGVYLRDVKRWMADLRGKDMAEAFSWSYKRRYKNVYVWQDLLDDDLITPICDNEYVLKGSEILPAIVHSDANAITSTLKNEKNVGVEDKEEEHSSKHEAKHASPDSLVNTSSEIYQESSIFDSERSTITEEDPMKRERINSEEEETDKLESFSSASFNSHSDFILSRNKKNKSNKKRINDASRCNDEKDEKGISSEFSMSCHSPKSQFGKSKSYSSGASKMIRNLITCGAVDTKDSALVYVRRSSRNTSFSKQDGNSGGSTTVLGIHRKQQYNYARKSFDGVQGSKKKHQQQQKSRFGAAAYKPVGAPTCSQCGKSFKPEKLHSHMRNCKGLKASTRTAAASLNKRPPSISNEIVAVSHE